MIQTLFILHPILAFGFSNLAMLGWLAAAAAPLLIHLWSRHRFREAPWAAMQFLLAALRKNSRRLQLQQWLLLALRTLLIALVVLAVAEPYGEQLVAGGASAPAHKVLVIDGSLSMAYRDNDTTRFARAKSLAAEMVQNSRAGDSFTVIHMAIPAKTIVGHLAVDHAAVRTQIESLPQLHTTADLAATLDLIEAALTEAAKDARAPRRHEVYFFTDLQRSTWEGSRPIVSHETNDAQQNRSPAGVEINERLAALAEKAAVLMIDVGQSATTNLAVRRVVPSEPLVTVGREVGLEVELRQFGPESRPGCNVELVVDQVPIGLQMVDVPAGGETTVRFRHRFSSPGEHTITVRAAADRLQPDDSRSLVVPVLEEIRVLCVAGREGAAKYVADALNPNPIARSTIRPVIVSEGQLADLDLADFDCIFLCNVAQLTTDEAIRLTQYAAAGDGVVIFLGDQVIPSSYNAFAPAGVSPVPISDFGFRISDSHSSPQSAIRNPQSAMQFPDRDGPLLPARIGDPVSQPQFGLDPLDYRHPIVAPFRGRERAGLLTTPLSRYFRLDMSQSPREAQVALATRSGDPLIVTAPLGHGRIALVATDGSLSSIDRATGEPWTLWPTWPSFLPVVRELLAYVGGGQDQVWEQLVSTPLHGSLANPPTIPAAGQHLQVTRPDGSTALVAIQAAGNGLEWSFDHTDVSGTYSLRGLPDGSTRQIAVNVDTSESDLAKVDTGKLSPEIVVRASTHNEADSRSTGAVFSHAAWSQPLLWAALAIMFAESFIAWRFGRGGA